jgi:ABC-type multidrug transport system fused ATPase/permease subunit
MLISVLDILSLAGILFIIHFYTQPSTYQISFLPSWLINTHSLALALVFLLFFLLKNLLAHYAHSLQYKFVYNAATRLSQANMLDYLEGNFAEHVHTDSAVYIRKISQQPIEFGHYVLAGLQQVITEIILVLLSVVAILIYNAMLFVIIALLLMPAALLLWFYTRKKINMARNNIKGRSADALQYLKEALAGYVESNIYGKNNFFTQRYAKSQQTLNTELANLHIIQGVPTRLLEVFAVFGLFILIVVANILGSTAFAGFIILGAFMAAAYKIIPGLVKIINLSGQIKAYRFTIVDLLAEKKIFIVQNAEACPPLQSITFNNISFWYQGHHIINNFFMHLSAKDFAGIAAPSGKGKTTIINILLGLVQQNEGHVCINDEIADIISRKKYWKRIAYVKQQNFLIHDTIEKNIILDEGDCNSDKLAKILQVTGLDAFVKKFTEGIKKVITENGKNISGGQRQRIAIARALFKEADLIILDEPFNELDHASEELLLHHFKKLAEEGKIIILITHQQKSLSFCNKIISLNA